MAKGFRAGQGPQGPVEACVDTGQGAAVRLVFAAQAVIAGTVGQRLQLGGTADQQVLDDGPARRQARMRLDQVVAKRRLRLPPEGDPQGPGVDIGIAIPVTADPVAHPEKRRHAFAEQRLDLGVELRQFLQERRAVVAEHVLDLVTHGQFGETQQSCLPELDDTGSDHRLVLGVGAGALRLAALPQKVGDGPLGVERAAPLHLGGMRGQHRRDEAARQGARNPLRLDAGVLEADKGAGQAAVGVHVVRLALGVPAPLVAVLGEVGEVGEVAEGADDRVGLPGLRRASSASRLRPASASARRW